ncbi:MAG: hypothetical protein HW387_1480 [Parachlamydiales bacterium]|nr:hypothetical protein [Parachlamydiales bacterium]
MEALSIPGILLGRLHEELIDMLCSFPWVRVREFNSVIY